MVCVTQRPNGARSAWRDRRSSWPLGASLLVVLVFGWLLAGTTMASAFGHVYDAPTVARVEVDTASLGRGAEAVRNAPHPYDARVPRGAPPSDAVGTPAPHQVSDAVAAAGGQRSEWLGTSTTPLAFVTATEAGAGLNAEGGVGAAEYGPQMPGGPKSTPNFKPPTNPAQMPPGEIPPGWRIREMPPTAQYPEGYWKLEKPMPNGGWQPIDPSTMKPGGRPETHVPFPPGG